MDCEKENINVVIVPENILQAIKNSSNLNVDISDAVNISNIQQKDDFNSDQDAINFQGLSNGNFWFMLSSDNLEINEASSSVATNSSSDDCVVTVVDSLPDLNCASTDNLALFSTCNASAPQVVLYPNCLINQESISGDNLTCIDEAAVSSSIDAPISSCTSSLGHLTSNNEAHLIASTVADDSYLPPSLPSSLEVSVNSEYKRTAAYESESTIINPPIISHQEVVKHSVMTADKGTYISGSVKPLHKCDVENCDHICKSALEYRKHKTTVHGKEKSYKCKYANCLWSFNTPYKLKRHLESHYKRKPYACTYPGCKAVFSSDYNQRVHAKLHYTIKPSRICQICGEVTANKIKLSKHMRDVHEQQPKFTCNICNNKFQTLAALVIHKKSHNPPLEYSCPVCGKTFKKRYYLKIHLYTHTDDKPYKCEQCDCGFASLSRLNRHMWIHKEDRKFACTEEDCERRFYRLNHLVQHMRKKHKVEPCSSNSVLGMYLNKTLPGSDEINFYECPACGLRCLSSHGLDRHKDKCDLFAAALHDEDHGSDGCAHSEGANEGDMLEIGNNLQVAQGENIIVEINSYTDDTTSSGREIEAMQCKDDETVDVEVSANSENLMGDRSLELTSSALVPSSLPDTCDDIVTDLEGNWNASLMGASSLPDPIATGHYLNCASSDPDSQVTLAPFMADMNVLNDAATQRFFQLNDEIASSSSGVSLPAQQVDENDVLKQYVVSSRDSKKSVSVSNCHGNASSSCNEVTPTTEMVSSNLFGDDVTLASSTATCCVVTPFSDSTINIDDIH